MIYRLPCINDEKMLREYVREHHDHGETSISASLGLASSDYSEWVEKIQRNALTGDAAWGKSLLYLCFDQDRLVGLLSIRYELPKELSDKIGDIGYGVRPSERNKGYATAMLRYALSVCKEKGMGKVLLGCYKDNLASAATIRKNGGILTVENNNDKENKTSQYYSITLSERKPEDMGKTERRMPTHIVAAAGIVVNSSGEILLVKNNRRGWEFPGGQVEVGENVIDAVKREIMEEAGVEIEVGEVFCISSNTCKYPGYNGVKEVPTKIMLDFICYAKEGTPRPSEENTASAFFHKDMVLELIQSPAYIERFKAFMDYMGRPIYLEYVTKPEFQLKIKRLI